MRRWYLPLTVLGVSGLGFLFFTRGGRRALRWAADNLQHAPGKLLEWNDAAQEELDRIQVALDRVAESLQVAR